MTIIVLVAITMPFTKVFRGLLISQRTLLVSVHRRDERIDTYEVGLIVSIIREQNT